MRVKRVRDIGVLKTSSLGSVRGLDSKPGGSRECSRKILLGTVPMEPRSCRTTECVASGSEGLRQVRIWHSCVWLAGLKNNSVKCFSPLHHQPVDVIALGARNILKRKPWLHNTRTLQIYSAARVRKAEHKVSFLQTIWTKVSSPQVSSCLQLEQLLHNRMLSFFSFTAQHSMLICLSSRCACASCMWREKLCSIIAGVVFNI